MYKSQLHCVYLGKKESITGLAKRFNIARSTLAARVRRIKETMVLDGVNVAIIEIHHLRPTQSALYREASSRLSTLWLKRSLVESMTAPEALVVARMITNKGITAYICADLDGRLVVRSSDSSLRDLDVLETVSPIRVSP